MEKQQKTKISIHPEAVNNLVDQAWEFINKVYWKRQTVREEEVDFIKDCIAEYFRSIPPEEFSEKSKHYLRNFRWQILLRAQMWLQNTYKQQFETPHELEILQATRLFEISQERNNLPLIFYPPPLQKTTFQNSVFHSNSFFLVLVPKTYHHLTT